MRAPWSAGLNCFYAGAFWTALLGGPRLSPGVNSKRLSVVFFQFGSAKPLGRGLFDESCVRFGQNIDAGRFVCFGHVGFSFSVVIKQKFSARDINADI